MDLSQEGFLMFFKDWQVAAFKALWNREEADSRTVWDAVNEHSEIRISRASIINFLEAMYQSGILDKRETTGKGGHKGVYSQKFDENGLKARLKKMFRERLEAF